MFLLNPSIFSCFKTEQRTLHSTMFLLNQAFRPNTALFDLPLHSTMFLLNQNPRTHKPISRQPLHSTMFLLNQVFASFPYLVFVIFTFHYVSIKSHLPPQHQNLFQPLHSTMFLLNPGITLKRRCINFRLYIPLCFY